MDAKIDPQTALIRENGNFHYANIVVVRKGDKNKSEIKAFITVLTSDKVKNFIKEKYESACSSSSILKGDRKMGYKIAFASSDGKVVNQHFGRTKQFVIVEIDDKEYKYVETRINEPPCQEFEHTEDALNKSIELIKDCKIVFVARIGQGALAQVEARGIKGIELPYFIVDIIDKILNSKINTIKTP